MSTRRGPLSFTTREVLFPVASHSLLAPKQPTGTPAQDGVGRGGFFFSWPWPVWGMAENGQESPVPQELRLGTETGGGLGSKHAWGPRRGVWANPGEEGASGEGLGRRDLGQRGAWEQGG